MERRPDKYFCRGSAILLEKESLWKNPRWTRPNHTKPEEKKRVCDIKSRNISFMSHLLRWACGSLSKTNHRFKRTQFAQKIRQDPKMKKKKKKTISVTVTYLLNGKTSRCKLSSTAEFTRVQAECQRCMKSLFNTRLLCEATGRFTRRARNRRSNARRYFGAVHLFLVYFVLFSPVSFFFFSKLKSCPNNFIYVFSLRWWICNYYCPRRDFAQKAKSREGSLVTRAYIKESTYSWNIQSVCQKKSRFA